MFPKTKDQHDITTFFQIDTLRKILDQIDHKWTQMDLNLLICKNKQF